MCSFIDTCSLPLVGLWCLRLCVLFGLLPRKEQTDKHLSHGLMCPAGEQEVGQDPQEQHTFNLMAKMRGVWLRPEQKVWRWYQDELRWREGWIKEGEGDRKCIYLGYLQGDSVWQNIPKGLLLHEGIDREGEKEFQGAKALCRCPNTQ